MEVPLALNHIKILQGLERKRMSSAFCFNKVGAVGLSALYATCLGLDKYIMQAQNLRNNVIEIEKSSSLYIWNRTKDFKQYGNLSVSLLRNPKKHCNDDTGKSYLGSGKIL